MLAPLIRGSLIEIVRNTAADIGVNPSPGWQQGRMPWAFIRALGLMMPMMSAIAEMPYLWYVPHMLSGTCLAERTEPLPQTPPGQAMRQALLELYSDYALFTPTARDQQAASGMWRYRRGARAAGLLAARKACRA
jgi:hypothetical protein